MTRPKPLPDKGQREQHRLKGTVEYTSWLNMRQRCNDKNHTQYHDYGGRGVKVCERWNKFTNFLADMGKRPDGMTLDRIDSDGDYEPSNCRWADRTTQARNHRMTRNNTTTGIVGVNWKRQYNKYRVHISVNKQIIELGYFDDLENAQLMRLAGEAELWT